MVLPRDAQSTAEAKEAISSLQQAGVSKFVFDLRNNVGGYFPAAVEIGRLLIDSGDIVLVADSEGVRDIYSATRTAIETQVWLLINAIRRGL